MSKGGPEFGGVKIFNERSSIVYVQVQLAVQQPDGSVVPSGQIPRIQVLGDTTQTPTSYAFGPGRPVGNCALVSVYDEANNTELASFGPIGVACRLPGGQLQDVFDVVVRVSPDVVGEAAYCAVQVRLHYGSVVTEPSGRKSVRASLKPGIDVDKYVLGTSLGSTIGTLDGSLRVGVQAGNLAGAKMLEQAAASDTFDDQWELMLTTAVPAQFSLVSLKQATPTEPVMSASIGDDARLVGGATSSSTNRLLLVKLLHNDGLGAPDVLDGWQIACADDGRLLTSRSSGAGTLRFMQRDSPEAVNQLWKITRSA